MSKPIRLSDLSPARQALVRLCQAINHGSIEDLEVRYSEPVFDPWPVTLRDVKLDSDEGPRPEVSLADFVVSDEVLRLMSLLDEMNCGTIRHIEVRAGIAGGSFWSPRSLGPKHRSGERETVGRTRNQKWTKSPLSARLSPPGHASLVPWSGPEGCWRRGRKNARPGAQALWQHQGLTVPVPALAVQPRPNVGHFFYFQIDVL